MLQELPYDVSNNNNTSVNNKGTQDHDKNFRIFQSLYQNLIRQ